jgi:hypothetical protein
MRRQKRHPKPTEMRCGSLQPHGNFANAAAAFFEFTRENRMLASVEYRSYRATVAWFIKDRGRRID